MHYEGCVGFRVACFAESAKVPYVDVQYNRQQKASNGSFYYAGFNTQQEVKVSMNGQASRKVWGASF